MNNFILMTDSYKLSHHGQKPSNTTKTYSYMESRGGLYPKTVFFGLQYYLKKYFEGPVVRLFDLLEAHDFSMRHFGADIFNYKGWQHIINKHGGYLPLKIKAVAEGSLVPVGNVLLTIENTDPKCEWLTNHCETLLSKLWAPITVATNSYYARKLINSHLLKTADNSNYLPWKLHDFGYRGVSSEESAGILGMSHLAAGFMGTDTLAAIIYANKYYSTNPNGFLDMFGYSVPASEHSVACCYGRNNEEDYFKAMLDAYPNDIIISIVSDTYDVFNFVKTMSEKFKDRILTRKKPVVFRPDSGDPVEVNMKLIDLLWNIFGGHITKNGYKRLIPQVGLIQGDGINNEMIDKILTAAALNGYSADNWVFGSGGKLLQDFTRDTQEFAIKASYGERVLEDGSVEGFDIYKQPITSSKKNSKAGKLKLIRQWDYRTINEHSALYSDPTINDWLEPVFEDGFILRDTNFDEVRKNVDLFFNTEKYD